MKFQKPSEALLQRFGVATSHWDPNSLVELLATVIPVVLIGEDRIDDERATWHFETSRPALAANAGFIALTPINGPIELLGVIANAPVAATACDLQIAPVPILWTTPPTVAGGTRQQSTGGPLWASCDAGYELTPFPAIYPLTALSNFSFPVQGTIIDPGYSAFLKCSALNVAFGGAFWWRNA